MKLILWNAMSSLERRQILSRPKSTRDPNLGEKVRDIIQAVRTRGDEALLEFSNKFDRVDLEKFRVSPSEVQQAYSDLCSSTVGALKEAIRRLTLFHEKQIPKGFSVQTSPGVVCERKYLPI